MGLFSNSRSPQAPTKTESAQPENRNSSDAAATGDVCLSQVELTQSRRSFLGRLLGDSVTTLGTAYLGETVLGLAPRYQEKRIADDHPAEREYPNTNTVTSFPSGRSFHNLGVCHTGRRFELDRDVIIDAIRQSDVVMVEGFAGQDYFDFLAAFAHEFEKVVIRLESQKSQVHDFGVQAALPLAAYMTASNAFYLADKARSICTKDNSQASRLDAREDDAKPNREDPRSSREPESYSSIRRAALTAGVALNRHVFGLGPHVRQFVEGQSEYPIQDTSYTMDGRTVLMLKDVQSWLERCPNLKLLVITGDLHAVGFSYYTSSPERFELFSNRARAYEAVYRSWLGGSPRIEHDPALKGEETPFGL